MAKHDGRHFLRHPMGKWALFVIVLFALWFGGWFVFASFVDGWVAKSLAQSEENGVRIECDNRNIKGFPFRIGVHCDDMNFAHKRDVFRIELGAFRSTAQIYAPGKIVAEIDGPFRSWPAGQEVSAKWSNMRLFVDSNQDGFDLASLTFADLETKAANGSIKAPRGALHLRPTPGSDQALLQRSLDGALNILDATIKGGGADIPPFTLEADATLVGGYGDLMIKSMPLRQILQDGAELDIRNLALVLPEGGRLAFAGPLEIHEDGLLSGTITVGLSKPETIVAWFESIDPNLKGPMNLISQPISAGEEKQIGGVGLKAVTISIDRGNPRLGFLPLPFQIPPIQLN